MTLCKYSFWIINRNREGKLKNIYHGKVNENSNKTCQTNIKNIDFLGLKNDSAIKKTLIMSYKGLMKKKIFSTSLPPYKNLILPTPPPPFLNKLFLKAPGRFSSARYAIRQKPLHSKIDSLGRIASGTRCITLYNCFKTASLQIQSSII